MTKRLKISHIAAAALGSILACSAAGAQMRGGAGAARMSSAHVRSAARMPSMSGGGAASSAGFQSARQATVIRILPNGRMASRFVPVANLAGFGSANGVPGLGFDYSHLAAVGRSPQSSQSLRLGRGGRHGQGFLAPILFGGVPYYFDSLDNSQYYDQSQQPGQQQPQVIVVQQPVAGQQGVDPGYDAAAQPLPSPAEADARVPDVGEFILVRRDGRILFASAFSVVGPQMQYVSPEGIRHTLPMTELDASATQQMNEARGTTVQISN